MKESVKRSFSNIPEHVERSVGMMTSLMVKVNTLAKELSEDKRLELNKLMNSEKFYWDLRNIAKLESILGVHLIEVV